MPAAPTVPASASLLPASSTCKSALLPAVDVRGSVAECWTVRMRVLKACSGQVLRTWHE